MRFIIIFLCGFFLLNKSFAETEKTIYEKIDLATGDGSTTTFAIGWTPPSAGSLFVTINGVLQSLDPYSAYMKPRNV